MWCKLVALFVILGMAITQAEAIEPHAEFSKFQLGYPFQLWNGPTRLWANRCSSPLVLVIPQKKAVLYTEANRKQGSWRAVVLRSYDGQPLWVSENALPPLGDYRDFVAGGESVLCRSDGPTFGGSTAQDLNDAGHWMDYYQQSPVTLLSLRNGQRIWTSNIRAIGFPIWSNGRVFLAVCWGLKRTHSAKRPTIEVWLEERTVAERRCLWKTRLPGHPPDEVRVAPAGLHRAKIFFQGPNWLSSTPNMKLTKALRHLNLNVPIKVGEVTAPALGPRSYKVSLN